jgi:hypothetical protein
MSIEPKPQPERTSRKLTRFRASAPLYIDARFG